mgnify:FL=1|jgi:hypothetical protein
MTRLAGAILLFVLGVCGALWVASSALSRASEHTVTYQYIADALDVLSAQPNHVTWRPARVALARGTTPGDTQLIGQTMTEAWSALALAQSTGNPAILAAAFSGVAQERAVQSVRDAELGGQMIVLAQEARPLFYHLDGSVFQAEVSLLTVRYMVQNDELSYFELVEDRAITTLMNESNGWRVYAHERVGSEPVADRSNGWSGEQLNGINYYPSLSPWREFWPAFDPDIIAQDFAHIAALNANAVRIFLTTEIFASSETSAQALRDLATLLTLAEAAGLQVIPTLFDLKPTFDPSAWGLDYAYLQAVLPVLADSPAVSFVDIKNEPDLDFEAHGRAQILAWLSTIAQLVHKDAPELAITIGWSASDFALELESIVDLVTYHDYAEINSAADRLAGVQANTDKPVMVTEIGVSSYDLVLGFPGSLSAQGDGLGERMDALTNADGVFVWTLYDFPTVDASAVGRSPWVKRVQGNFGLFASDSSEKPSAALVRDAFAMRATAEN